MIKKKKKHQWFLTAAFLFFHTFSYQSTDPTASCSLPALHLRKEFKKPDLRMCWLMSQWVFILCLTEVLSKESYYFSDVHSTTEESPWIFITAASWDILSMSWITCTLIKIPKDDKFRRCQCQAVKQLCYLSAMKADNLQCGLHTNRVIILAFFLDSCIKWKQLSTVIFCHHCFQIFNLYLTTCQTT